MVPPYVTVEEAIGLPGLRVAFTQGVPGPWGEAMKAFLSIKRLSFTLVIQQGGGPNEPLVAWTGQNSAPVAVLDDEWPRAHWSELLILAERLAPEPSLARPLPELVRRGARYAGRASAAHTDRAPRADAAR